MEKTSYITSVADLFVPKKAGSISLATTLIFAVLLFIRSLLVLYNINRIRKRCSSEGSETSGGHTESYGFGKRNLRRKKLRRLQPVKTLVVFGSGGHTTEMLSMIRHLPPTRYSPLVHVVANTDTTSIERIRTAAADGKSRLPNVTYRIPRSREVGQSYLTSIGTTMYSFVYAWCIVFRVRPDLVLCNGPGTCLPLAYCTFISRMLGLCRGNIVFVESFCRVLR